MTSVSRDVSKFWTSNDFSQVLDTTFDLFGCLGADDEACDFPVVQDTAIGAMGAISTSFKGFKISGLCLWL